ncbi:MAG TPA: hypothetical protein VG815_08445 [Chloroflexota bacterium]|jgi:hypothetical protein|nr:hypothetical protein [Chloroflexota bacterium]
MSGAHTVSFAAPGISEVDLVGHTMAFEAEPAGADSAGVYLGNTGHWVLNPIVRPIYRFAKLAHRPIPCNGPLFSRRWVVWETDLYGYCRPGLLVGRAWFVLARNRLTGRTYVVDDAYRHGALHTAGPTITLSGSVMAWEYPVCRTAGCVGSDAGYDSVLAVRNLPNGAPHVIRTSHDLSWEVLGNTISLTGNLLSWVQGTCCLVTDKWTFFVRNLRTQVTTKRQIPDSLPFQAVYGYTAIYLDPRAPYASEGRLAAVDLRTNRVTTVGRVCLNSRGPACLEGPRDRRVIRYSVLLDGQVLVWSDERHGAVDLIARDLRTGRQYLLNRNASEVEAWSVWRRTVAWVNKPGVVHLSTIS